jgi:hypothetical protein
MNYSDLSIREIYNCCKEFLKPHGDIELFCT